MNVFYLRDRQSLARSLPSLALWGAACGSVLLPAPFWLMFITHILAIEATFRANFWFSQNWPDTRITSHSAEALFEVPKMRNSGYWGKISTLLIAISLPIYKSMDLTFADLRFWDVVLAAISYLIAYSTLHLLVFHHLMDHGQLVEPPSPDQDPERDINQ